ncbi:MAG: Maf family protein [Acidiferrobacteraceae bacterium]
MKIYLASKSPRRSELLRQIGVAFDVIPHTADESRLPGEAPKDYAGRLAWAKARAGAEGLAQSGRAERPVLGADTIVSIDGDLLGKPRDRVEAGEMLARLSGRTHEVVTAVAFSRPGRAGMIDALGSALVVTRVTFDPLTVDDIEAYLGTGEFADKAGAYGIQGRAAAFVAGIEGSYSAVMGLPLREVARLLRKIPEGRP